MAAVHGCGGLVGDPLEDVVEVEFRVEPVEFCGAGQGIDLSGAFSSCV